LIEQMFGYTDCTFANFFD